MEQEEKALAVETLQGFLAGIEDLFLMALEATAPAGYEIIIKKSGTDDFIRERTIGGAKSKQAAEQEQDETVTYNKELLKGFIKSKMQESYNKGYNKGYRDGKQPPTPPKPNKKSKDNYNGLK